MIKSIFTILFSFALTLSFAACDADEGETTENTEASASESPDDEQDVTELSEDDGQEEAAQTDENLTLPDSFPTDFPIPENIVLTQVDDDSDEEEYSYFIEFTFDPNLDLDATFEMYSKYTEQVGYNVVIGGDEYFAEGIFQYGANNLKADLDMFIVTLKPENGTYGSIKLSVSK